MKADVLVLGAIKRELEGVLTKLGEPLVLAGREVVGLTLGVGKVQSALAAMQAVQTYAPSSVVLLGYAGAIDAGLAIGDGFVATKVVQYDLDLRAFALQRGQTFDENSKVAASTIDLYAPALSGFKQVVLGTADRFLLRSYREQNPYLSEELGLQASDMEGFAVARACQVLGLPCSILKVVSDDGLGRRPKDFKRFVRQADECLRMGLAQLLELPSEKSPTSL
jgi:adenosylhomocysteine nucleosidase